MKELKEKPETGEWYELSQNFDYLKLNNFKWIDGSISLYDESNDTWYNIDHAAIHQSYMLNNIEVKYFVTN